MLVRAQRHSSNIVELVRLERRVFAAKLRTARALLNLSQAELADRVGLTQRAIHKLEQGETEPRRATVHAVDEVLRTEGLSFEQAAGGLRLSVESAVLNRAVRSKPKQRKPRGCDLGVTRQSQLVTYRA